MKKFRAWDGTENRFYPWTDDLLVSCSGKIFEVDYDDVEEGTPIECFNCFEIEQFTGLHDKNGKEIYEGDIVQSKNHKPDKMEIRFIEGGFCAWWGNDDYPIDINHFYDSLGCCIEVIGNIHENPELLND